MVPRKKKQKKQSKFARRSSLPQLQGSNGSVAVRKIGDMMYDLKQTTSTAERIRKNSVVNPIGDHHLIPTQEITDDIVANLQHVMDQRASDIGIKYGSPTIPKNERERLNNLREYLIEQADEEPLNNIVQIVSSACETPIALVSIVDVEKQWFKVRVGLEAKETPREVSFCAHAINKPREIFIVEDAFIDERFKDNPLVTGKPDIRFYAGVPLVSTEGHAFGTLCAIDTKPRILSEVQKQIMTQLAKQVVTELTLRHYVDILQRSVQTADDLLCNILPKSVVPRLKEGEMIADDIQCASILFADLKGFTAFSVKHSAKDLVSHLGKLFQEIDELSMSCGVVKIKTIGDCYMAAAGVPEEQDPKEHTQNMVRFAFGIQDVLRDHNEETGTNFQMRVGIACGPVTAGVVGSIRFHYDLWGSTVNLASRIESTGVPDNVCISESCYEILKDLPDEPFLFESRGKIEMKGLDPQPVYFIRENDL